MSDSLRDKLKRILQGAFLSHVPDHPSHGGNTGETEWNSGGSDDSTDDQTEKRGENETDGDQFDSR